MSCANEIYRNGDLFVLSRVVAHEKYQFLSIFFNYITNNKNFCYYLFIYKISYLFYYMIKYII